MDKLKDALQVLLGHANKDEVVALMEADGKPLFQPIFQKGHNVGYGQKHGELEKATARVAEIETQLATTKGELDTLKANPDTKALHQQYGAQIADLTKKATDRERELTERVAGERKTQRLAMLRTALITGDKRLVTDYADVLLEKADVIKRIKMNDDGTWQVLQKGKDIPIGAQTPEAALLILADELRAEAPSTMILVGTDSGGGITTGVGRPAGTTTEDALAKSIRDGVTARVTTATKAPKPHGAFAVLESPE